MTGISKLPDAAPKSGWSPGFRGAWCARMPEGSWSHRIRASSLQGVSPDATPGFPEIPETAHPSHTRREFRLVHWLADRTKGLRLDAAMLRFLHALARHEDNSSCPQIS